MGKVILLLLSLVCVYAFPAIKEESADEAVNDEFIENMYRKEIEEGDNAEEPLEPTKNTKHRNAKKKHLHGHFGAPFGHGFDSHGLGMDYPISHVHGIHGGIGHPIAHHGYGMHHGHDFHDPIGHPVVVSPGHGHELPIIFPHHDHHRHQHHHPHHMGYYHPEFMPMPYPMPMCVMGKWSLKIFYFLLALFFAVRRAYFYEAD